LSNTFVEKHSCLRDFGLGLEVVGVERLAKGFRIGNVVGDLAMIEVWSEGDETGLGQPRAECLRGVVQPPPCVEDQHSVAVASGGNGEVAGGLGMRHLHIPELLRVS